MGGSLRTSSLSDEELGQLLYPAAGAFERGPLRAQAAVRLLAYEGLTADQAVELRIADFRPGQGLRRGRLVQPLGEESERQLERLLAGELTGTFLLGSQGRQITSKALRDHLVRFGRSRGVAAVSPERLRRTFARRLYQAGASEQELLDALSIRSPEHLRKWLRADPQLGLERRRRPRTRAGDAGAGAGSEGSERRQRQEQVLSVEPSPVPGEDAVQSLF